MFKAPLFKSRFMTRIDKERFLVSDYSYLKSQNFGYLPNCDFGILCRQGVITEPDSKAIPSNYISFLDQNCQDIYEPYLTLALNNVKYVVFGSFDIAFNPKWMIGLSCDNMLHLFEYAIKHKQLFWLYNHGFFVDRLNHKSQKLDYFSRYWYDIGYDYIVCEANIS